MPFFIRGRGNSDHKGKPTDHKGKPTDHRGKPKKALVKGRGRAQNAFPTKFKQAENGRLDDSNNYVEEEEVTSEEEERFIHTDSKRQRNDGFQYEEVEESAQDKKIRLAKQYLEEIKRQKEEEAEFEDEDELNFAVGRQLKEDVLEAAGKLQKPFADSVMSVDENNIKFLRCKHHNRALTCLAVSADERYIYTASKDCSIVKWSIDGSRLQEILGRQKKTEESSQSHMGHVTSLALSSDGKFLVSGDICGVIHVWDAKSLLHLKKFVKHKKVISGLAFRRGTNTLFSASHDRMVNVYDLDSMMFVENLGGHQDNITGLDALKRDSCITSGGRDNMVIVYGITDEKQLRFTAKQESIEGVKLINEKTFLTYGQNGTLNLWITTKKRPCFIVRDAHGKDPENSVPRWVTALACLVNTDLVASGSMDGFINLWKVEHGKHKLIKMFSIPVKGVVNGLEFTQSGSHLIAVVGKEHKLGRWFTEKEAKNALVIIPLDTT